MILTPAEFYELNPDKKDVAYAKRKVQNFLLDWQPLVAKSRYEKNMGYLFGTFDQEFVRKLFNKKPEEMGIELEELKMMEKLRNIIVAEIENAGISIEVDAKDPSATNERQKDRDLLKNKGAIEAVLTGLGKRINRPAFKLSDKKELFNGNVDKFSDMGLDNNSGEDLEYFFSTFYRLRHEAVMELPINYFLSLNECQQMLPRFVNDVMAVKAISSICYVDLMDGQQKVRYIRPDQTYWIQQKREDGKDALCKGYRDLVTVGEFIRRVGKNFDWDRDWPKILQAINNSSNAGYTGIIDGRSDGPGHSWGDMSHPCDVRTFFNYKISLGYIEWKEVNGKKYKHSTSAKGNPKLRSIPYDRKDKEQAKELNYAAVEDYTEDIYCTYFLDTVGNTYLELFGYGKVAYQQVEGLNDEIANYTICTYVDSGSSAVEISIPHLKKIAKLWAKCDYLLGRIKAPGMSYDVASLYNLLPLLQDEGGKMDVMGLIKMLNEGEDSLHTSRDSEDQQLGGSGYPNQEITNGLTLLTAALVALRNEINIAVEDINNQIGISPIRDAYAPKERDTFKLQQASLTTSRQATQYIGRSINSMFTNICNKFCNYTQYIVQYKDINKKPYKVLVDAIGDVAVEIIESLGKVAQHRYNIFVEPFDSKYDREEIKMIVQQAYVNKEINPETLMLINSIDSPKKAMMVFIYESNKKRRNDEKAAQAASQRKIQETEASTKGQLAIEQMKGKNMVDAKNIEGEWYWKAMTDTELIKQQGLAAKLAAKPGEINAQKDADVERINATAEASNQNASPFTA